jgi:hypothetical protein
MTLLHSFWFIVLVAVAARAVDHVLGRRSVRMTYAAYVAALVGCLAALPLTFATVDVAAVAPTTVLPGRHLQALPEGDAREFERPAASHTVLFEAAPEGELRQEGGDPAESRPPRVAGPQALVSLSGPEEPAGPKRTSNDWSAAWCRWSPWFVGLYVAGVFAMLARLAGGVWRARRLVLRAETIHEGPLVDLLRTAAARWSMRVVPTLARAREIVVPKVVGLVRPTILLPPSGEDR